MNILEVLESEKNDYNHFVMNQPSGSFLQSYEWGKWQEKLGRQIFRYWILDIAGKKQGSMQLIKMPLMFGKYYLYCPYGPVGAEKYELGIKNYEWLTEELKNKFSDCVFLRIEPKKQSAISDQQSAIKTSNIQPGKTLIINLAKTEEQLLAEMHPKTRYNIRLAEKHGVEIHPVKSPSGDGGRETVFNGVKDEFEVSIGHGLFAKEAVGLIASTAKRQGYKGYNEDYYRAMVDFFSLQGKRDLGLHIYKAIYQNQLLASAIMLDFYARGGSASGGGTRTFLFGGSSESNKNVMAPYLMHYRAMLDAKVNGLEFYDFWGVETSSGGSPGFVRFKIGFSPNTLPVEYIGAYDLIYSKFWYKIYAIIRRIKRIF